MPKRRSPLRVGRLARRAWPTALVGLVLTAGCAFNDVPLTLPTKGLQHTLRGGDGRQVVVAIPFEDAREIRHRCGMQKNGYNMDTADAVCQSDPAQWLARMLAEELRASGFEVLREGEAHRASALRLDGALLKIFVEPVIGMWTGSLEADLSVRLVATSETGLRAERMFFVKGWKGGQMFSTLQPYHTALTRATHDLLEEMVRAVIDLVDRYPELGLRGGSVVRLALGGVRP